tara:strand:- start:21 stop:245 length:225 start_codon:yes stop_codon:yes gene_type:complete
MARIPSRNKNTKQQELGKADMSAVPTPMTDALQLKPTADRIKELRVRSSDDQNLYKGGYVKKYAHGGGVRKVRY